MEELINKNHQGECIEIMSKLGDKSVNLILTDPPYNASKGGVNLPDNKTGGAYYKVNEEWDKFDKYLIEKALSDGAELVLRHRFLNNNKNKIKFENKSYDTNVIIGADGSLSRVAKANNLGNKNFFLGLQARIKLKKATNS